MRFVFDYRLPTGSSWVMIFSAENEAKAEEYVRDLVEKYNYQEVSTIHSIITIEDLYHLYFPKRTSDMVSR
jgi:hypothetical protein